MGSGESAICSKGEGADWAAAALREGGREGEAGRKFKGEGVMTRLSGEQCEEGMGSSIQKREG